MIHSFLAYTLDHGTVVKCNDSAGNSYIVEQYVEGKYDLFIAPFVRLTGANDSYSHLTSAWCVV